MLIWPSSNKLLIKIIIYTVIKIVLKITQWRMKSDCIQHILSYKVKNNNSFIIWSCYYDWLWYYQYLKYLIRMISEQLGKLIIWLFTQIYYASCDSSNKYLFRIIRYLNIPNLFPNIDNYSIILFEMLYIKLWIISTKCYLLAIWKYLCAIYLFYILFYFNYLWGNNLKVLIIYLSI